MRSLLLLCIVALGSVVGCMENVPTGKAGGGPKAECLVCKHENDLACVEVDVDSKTPRATVDGKAYYFCSEDCHKAFLKNPAKYISSK